ncbi:MAG: LptF/LptG family permease [Bacteroidales bacterium]|nr:LptF/LptG family permease [Bacteroidales bacterium]
MIKKLDRYIIRKFLGTFFLARALIILLAVVFDFSEKVDDFITNKAPMKDIIFQYYFNFIPFFSNLFSYLFVFVAVIFFTSKMSMHNEITAILSTGVSYRRLMYPYLVSAMIIFVLSFLLSNYFIPYSSIKRLEFEAKYFDKAYGTPEHNIHKQIDKDVYIYLESFSRRTNWGTKFSMEKFEDGKLKSKLMAESIRYDSLNRTWKIKDYWIRDIDSLQEVITAGKQGESMDTALNLLPDEFNRRANVVEAMTTPQLKRFIKREHTRGHVEPMYDIERHRRFAGSFAIFILTIIGVTLSSRKVRGGMGMHIGLGIALSFSYILFMQISKEFARADDLSPWMSVWLPNFIFAAIALVLYKLAPK